MEPGMTARRSTVWPLVLGLTVLACTVWLVFLQFTKYSHHGISDLPVYEAAERQMAAGQLPYRDFPLEYPPAAAGLFWLAGALPGAFGPAFSALMLVCLLATLVGVIATARVLGASRRRTLGAGLVVALCPLVLGNMVETRFDLLFAAVLAWTAWAICSKRFAVAWTLIAVGTLVKLLPLALIPLLLVVHARHRGARRAAVGLAASLGGLAAAVAPFAIMSPRGTWGIVSYHLDRPLQIESTGASYIEVIMGLVGRTVSVTNSFGSQGLPGHGPSVVAAISTALLGLAIVLIAATVWFLLRRVRPDEAAQVTFAGLAATVGALLVFGKVLSPQFLIWLLPVAFLVSGRFGRVAFAAALAAMILTLVYFPYQYWDLVAMDGLPVAQVAVRNALLMVFLAAAWPRPVAPPAATLVTPGRTTLAKDAPESAFSARFLID